MEAFVRSTIKMISTNKQFTKEETQSEEAHERRLNIIRNKIDVILYK